MNRYERLKAVNSFMNLVYQYGNCSYIQGKNEGIDEDKYMYSVSESDNLRSIIKFEIYALIDKLDTEEKEGY